MWGLVKNTGNPIYKGLPKNTWEWPNTVTFAIALRQKYDSFLELTEVPPEEYWDYPVFIRNWVERLYPHSKNKTSADISMDDVET